MECGLSDAEWSQSCFNENKFQACQDRCDNDPNCLMFAMNFVTRTSPDSVFTCCLNTCNSNETCTDWIPRGTSCTDPSGYTMQWSAWIKHGTTFQISPSFLFFVNNLRHRNSKSTVLWPVMKSFVYMIPIEFAVAKSLGTLTFHGYQRLSRLTKNAYRTQRIHLKQCQNYHIWLKHAIDVWDETVKWNCSYFSIVSSKKLPK